MRQLLLLTSRRMMVSNHHLSSTICDFKRYFLAWVLMTFFSLCSFADYKEIQIGLNDYLSEKLNSKFENVDSLKIYGYFHTDDINFIRDNLSATVTSKIASHPCKKGNLSYLDLHEAVFADRGAGGYMKPMNKLPKDFGNGLAISVLKLPEIIVGDNSFCNNPYLIQLELSNNSEIGSKCFNNCDALEKVFIPIGCKFTGMGFYNTCFMGNKFKSYNVDPSNQSYKSVDGLLLDKEGKKLLAVPYGLEKIKVPDSVESINSTAIEVSPNIKVIQFGSNLTSFDGNPFSTNKGLDRIIIQTAFPLNLPKKGVNISFWNGCDHFKRCGYLYVPLGTSHYYRSAPGWEEVPNIIEYSSDELVGIFDREIDDDPFGYEFDFKVDGIYYKITSFEENTVGVVNGYKPYKGSYDIPEEIIYNNRKFSVTSISMGGSNVTHISIPNTVTSIGSLFGSFEKIVLPKSILKLGNGAFSGCENLKRIDIPETVNYIPKNAFKCCHKLEEVNWRPNYNHASIEEGAFFDCISLKSFAFGSNITSTGSSSYDSYPRRSSFYNCIALDSISLEPGSSMLFGYYQDISSHGDTNYMEFYGSTIKKMYLGRLFGRVTLIPSFEDLEDIVIGDEIEIVSREYLRDSYFPSLHGLRNLTIGSQVSRIETFSSENIWIRNPIPPKVDGTLSNNVYLNSKLYVPKGTISVYQNAPVWKNFFNIEEYECDYSIVNPILTTDDSKYPMGIYDINGIKYDNLIRGLNIIHYSDGTVEKIFK